jgi:uncharacterized protein YdaU (DUF1376 family)
MSNRELPMMPWYPDQFAASTVAWSFVERSLYRALLDCQWQLGSLPNDPKRLALCVGLSEEEFLAAWDPLVKEKFTVHRGALINKRLEYHKNLSRDRKQRLSNAGRTAGRASAERRRNESSDDRPTVVGVIVNPPTPTPSPSEDIRPLTPQSGDSAVNGHGRRQAGKNPRALGSNPRAIAAQADEQTLWQPLLRRAESCGFRKPHPIDTPASYETSLRLYEREHPRIESRGAQP